MNTVPTLRKKVFVFDFYLCAMPIKFQRKGDSHKQDEYNPGIAGGDIGIGMTVSNGYYPCWSYMKV